jgi:hypothetical protein
MTPTDVRTFAQYLKPSIEIWGVGRATYVMIIFLWSLLLENGVFTQESVDALTQHIDTKMAQAAEEKATLAGAYKGKEGIIMGGGRRTGPSASSNLTSKPLFKTGMYTLEY